MDFKKTQRRLLLQQLAVMRLPPAHAHPRMLKI
jgi:hypothetical protein